MPQQQLGRWVHQPVWCEYRRFHCQTILDFVNVAVCRGLPVLIKPERIVDFPLLPLLCVVPSVGPRWQAVLVYRCSSRFSRSPLAPKWLDSFGSRSQSLTAHSPGYCFAGQTRRACRDHCAPESGSTTTPERRTSCYLSDGEPFRVNEEHPGAFYWLQLSKPARNGRMVL